MTTVVWTWVQKSRENREKKAETPTMELSKLELSSGINNGCQLWIRLNDLSEMAELDDIFSLVRTSRDTAD